MSEFPGVEIHHAHGLRDFMQEVEEDVERVLGHHDNDLPDEIAKGLPHDLPTVRTRDESPATAHYRTWVLPGGQAIEISLPYPNRANLTVVCQSGGPVFIGADNEIPNAVSPLSVQLANGASRTFTHTDKVFCNGPANAVVDVVEEHYPAK